MEGLKSHMATVPNPWIYPKYPKVAIVTSYLSFLQNVKSNSVTGLVQGLI